MWRARRMKLSTRILVNQLAILVGTMLVGFGLFAHQMRLRIDQEFQQRALAVAQSVAGMPEIQGAIEYGGGGDVVQTTAQRVRRATGVRYVVVIDRNRARHSHPIPSLIGKRVAEPLVVLDGHDHLGMDPGTLCRSANAKTPLTGPTGSIVGEVSVGTCESRVYSALWGTLPPFALWFGLALLFGGAGSYLLASRLKRQTFGLELAEIANLLQEREAMLHGIKEGVIAFDLAGRVSMINDEARRLLRLPASALGRPLDEIIPPGVLRDVLAGVVTGPDVPILTDEHVLTVNRRVTRLGGRELGAVVSLRDRTEMSGLMRELDSVRGLTDALRAQQHEFANRMHTVTGLLELGEPEEALSYLTTTEGDQKVAVESVREKIANPQVVGLILAKTTIAAERGVTLRLADDAWLGENPPHTQALLTILGNLIDNAVDAAAGTPGAAVGLRLTDGDRITLTVSDTGPGIPPGSAQKIFTDGFSTKPRTETRHRGLGLAIVHRLVHRIGGEIHASEGAGARFTVDLPATRAEDRQPPKPTGAMP